MSAKYCVRLEWACLIVVLSLACDPAAGQVATQPAGAAAAAPSLSTALSTRPAEVPASQPAALVRGPYLQALRTDGLVICLEPARDTAGKIVITEPDSEQSFERPSEAYAGRIARINIAGLEPGRTYNYEVLLDGAADPACQATLTTAPPPGMLPVTFIVTGDSRTNAATFKAVCDAMLKTNIPLFIHTGDFVDQGRQVDRWNPQFFDPARKLIASAVILPAIGNHELSGTGPDAHRVYASFFVLPQNRTFYSLDYGGVHIIILDSCRRDFEGSDQYNWLIQDLAACKAPWKVAAFHNPWFDAGHHGNDLDARRLYEPLFVKHGVDLIVAGHDHNYQRTRPIVHVFEPKSGKPYWQIVSGGAGAPLYPVLKSDIFVERCVAANHFVTLTAEKDHLSIAAIDLNGGQLDRFEIRKDEPAEHPVPFEQIELEETLNRWLPRHTLSFVPATSTATLTCTWTNPYPVPVRLQFAASDSEHWQLTTDPVAIEVPPRSSRQPGTQDIRFRVRKLGPPADLEDKIIGINAAYQAPQIGSGMLRNIRVPIIAARSVLPTTAAKITVDGRLDESCWSQAASPGILRELKSSAAEPSMIATNVKTAVDSRNLYLAITCNLPGGWTDRTDPDITKADHVQIDLAPAQDKLSSLILTPGGKRQTSGARMQMDAQLQRTADGWTIECAVPLRQFTGTDQVRLNVHRHTNGRLYVLAPLAGTRFDFGAAIVVPLVTNSPSSQAAPVNDSAASHPAATHPATGEE